MLKYRKVEKAERGRDKRQTWKFARQQETDYRKLKIAVADSEPRSSPTTTKRESRVVAEEEGGKLRIKITKREDSKSRGLMIRLGKS